MLKIFGALQFFGFLVPLTLGFLMYPKDGTNIGLTASISVPVVEYLPERRILIDWCFNMGYSLPSSPSQFYSIPIWPGVPGTKGKRDLSYGANEETHFDLFEKYKNSSLHSKRHPSDYTAGEMYQGIEDFLVTYGFHETCLLRTVCELARHPFDDEHQNIVTEMFTFLLTPSLHNGFDQSEILYREVYEEAETRGFYGEDCEKLYPECHKDLLSIITKVIFLKE